MSDPIPSLAARAADAATTLKRITRDRSITRARVHLARILGVQESEVRETGTFTHREGGPYGLHRDLDLLTVRDLEFVIMTVPAQAQEIHLLVTFEDEETDLPYRAVEATAIATLADIGEALARRTPWFIPQRPVASLEERHVRALERIAELLDGWRNGR